MSDCKPPKRTLGISFNPLSIGVECDCWDAIIIPIPATILLKSLPQSVVKNAGYRLFPNQIRSLIKNFLGSKLSSILNRLDEIQRAVFSAERSIIDKRGAINALENSLKNITADLDSIKIRLKQAASRLLEKYAELKELNRSGISSPPLSLDDYINDPRIGPPAGVLAYIEQLEKLVKIRKAPNGKYEPIGGSLYDEFSAEKSRIQPKIDEYARAKEKLRLKIDEEEKAIAKLQLEQDKLNQSKPNWENLLDRADTDSIESIGELVGDTIVGGASIGAKILDMIIFLLSVFEFVQKHECIMPAKPSQR
jgi:hypothetical protein